MSFCLASPFFSSLLPLSPLLPFCCLPNHFFFSNPAPTSKLLLPPQFIISLSPRPSNCLCSALVSTPSVSSTPDGTLQVNWRSQGQGRGVFGYRVLYRPPGAGWNPYGYVVVFVSLPHHYSIDQSNAVSSFFSFQPNCSIRWR